MSDVDEAKSLLRGQKIDDYGDSGYQSVEKRPDAKGAMRWHVESRRLCVTLLAESTEVVEVAVLSIR